MSVGIFVRKAYFQMLRTQLKSQSTSQATWARLAQAAQAAQAPMCFLTGCGISPEFVSLNASHAPSPCNRGIADGFRWRFHPLTLKTVWNESRRVSRTLYHLATWQCTKSNCDLRHKSHSLIDQM